MRKARFIALLGAGIILSLAGCQKGPESSKTANLVQFKATSGAPLTRTAYATGENAHVNGFHRIDWKPGDQVLVWSGEAINQLSPATKQYTYEVGTIETLDEKSIASAYDDASKGLTWTEGVSTFKFCAYYPATGGFTATETDANGNPATVKATVPATQAITFANGYGTPDMQTAYMLAKPVSVARYSTVDLQFSPAYTAFEINVSSTDAVTITGLTLISEARTNGANTFGPSAMSGDFTATVGESAWTFPAVAATDGNAKVTPTFEAIELTKANEEDAKTNTASFVVFALPQDIASVTLDFTLTKDGVEQHRRASLTYAKDGEGFAKGDPVTFAARKKHNINLTLAPINKDVELILQVMPWEDETGTITYGPDAVLNAAALEFVSGAAITDRGGRRRNNNFASAYEAGTDGKDANPIWAYFYVFSPVEEVTSGEGGSATTETKWEITVTGDISKLDVNVLQTEGMQKNTADGKLVITGPTGGRVDFTVSRKDNTVTDSNSIHLDFAVVMSDGRRISANSEVTRGTGLNITGKVGR